LTFEAGRDSYIGFVARGPPEGCWMGGGCGRLNFLKKGVVTMGKGDRRTKRGKIWRGSFGKSRPSKKKGKEAK
jgi:30S ribosomal protein S31